MGNLCLVCGKILRGRSQKEYCSNTCQSEKRFSIYIEEWRKGKQDGGMGVSSRSISRHVRRYLLEKYGRCQLCGWNKRNPITKKLVLEIDHIDGNSENNKENNLRLLCPNCHALTGNFKNLNRGKGRVWRKNKYKKNSI